MNTDDDDIRTAGDIRSGVDIRTGLAYTNDQTAEDSELELYKHHVAVLRRYRELIAAEKETDASLT